MGIEGLTNWGRKRWRFVLEGEWWFENRMGGGFGEKMEGFRKKGILGEEWKWFEKGGGCGRVGIMSLKKDLCLKEKVSVGDNRYFRFKKSFLQTK